ncbi:MAG: MscL family protein, partial [Clostridia bacterium]|nr:MscL family protein [Clostridia bacterium]
NTESLSEVYTYLKTAYTVDETGAEVIDHANSIYIDWGTFVNSIINFFMIAMTLFIIARIVRHIVTKAKAKELAAAAEAEAKKSAEEQAAAAAASEAAAEAAAKKEAELQAFYANVARQTELLEQLAKKQ